MTVKSKVGRGAAVGRGVAAVFGTPDPKTVIKEPSAASRRKGNAGDASAQEHPPVKKTGKLSPPKTQSAAVDDKKRPGAAPDGKVKVTWYIDEHLFSKIKHLAVDLRKRDSVLVTECLEVGLAVFTKKAGKK